jgi:hypothetical protein
LKGVGGVPRPYIYIIQEVETEIKNYSVKRMSRRIVEVVRGTILADQKNDRERGHVFPLKKSRPNQAQRDNEGIYSGQGGFGLRTSKHVRISRFGG